MKVVSVRTLALASLASLAMATPSSAVPILSYAQPAGTNLFVQATATGSTTTLTTVNATGVVTPLLVNITNIANTPIVGPPLPGLLTFEGVQSTGAASVNASGQITQLFSGTVRIVSPTGTNILTTVFTNAAFSGEGNAGSLAGSRPPDSVTFSSAIPEIQALIAGNPPENFSLTFTNITPTLSISGGTLASFRTNNTQGGNATGETAVVPEPSGIVMAGTAMIAGLGCFGWRRRQLSRA